MVQPVRGIVLWLAGRPASAGLRLCLAHRFRIAGSASAGLGSWARAARPLRRTWDSGSQIYWRRVFESKGSAGQRVLGSRGLAGHGAPGLRVTGAASLPPLALGARDSTLPDAGGIESINTARGSASISGRARPVVPSQFVGRPATRRATARRPRRGPVTRQDRASSWMLLVRGASEATTSRKLWGGRAVEATTIRMSSPRLGAHAGHDVPVVRPWGTRFRSPLMLWRRWAAPATTCPECDSASARTPGTASVSFGRARSRPRLPRCRRIGVGRGAHFSEVVGSAHGRSHKILDVVASGCGRPQDPGCCRVGAWWRPLHPGCCAAAHRGRHDILDVVGSGARSGRGRGASRAGRGAVEGGDLVALAPRGWLVCPVSDGRVYYGG